MEKGDGDEAMTAATEDAGDMGTQIIDMKIKIEVEVKVKGSITRIGDEVKKTFDGADAGHGRIMIPITVTGIIGIDLAKAKVIVTEVGNGMATGDKMTVTEAEVDDGTNRINMKSYFVGVLMCTSKTAVDPI